jgi:hypothetical protein
VQDVEGGSALTTESVTRDIESLIAADEKDGDETTRYSAVFGLPQPFVDLWLQMVMVILLDKVTTWDVVHNREVKPGQTRMFEHSQYGKEVHADKQDLVAGIAVSAAEGWDTGPRCRQWRQQRYDHAVAQGLTQREAIANTLCCNFSGFIDDGQLSTIASGDRSRPLRRTSNSRQKSRGAEQ